MDFDRAIGSFALLLLLFLSYHIWSNFIVVIGQKNNGVVKVKVQKLKTEKQLVIQL